MSSTWRREFVELGIFVFKKILQRPRGEDYGHRDSQLTAFILDFWKLWWQLADEQYLGIHVDD